MGCCDVSPCSQGCTRDNLLPAILSTKKANRNAFLDPESVYSSTVATSSATASASASASSSADSDDGGGLSHGAVAGIAAASAAVGVILIGFLIWRCWWYPRHRKQNSQQFHPVGSQTHHAGGPGEFDPNQSPMGTTPIHEMEGVYPTPQQLSTDITAHRNESSRIP
ncbi:hypothetical protein EDB80DRAFT_730912 [Ilyonectria destructans]|nr:hypothetical protein EDB80DRAFT_730912 [Ilyonectria destructans]